MSICHKHFASRVKARASAEHGVREIESLMMWLALDVICGNDHMSPINV